MPDISIFSRFEQGKSIPSGMLVPIKHKFILHFSPKLLDFQPPPVELEVLLVVRFLSGRDTEIQVCKNVEEGD